MQASTASNADWHGHKHVVDNIDKKFKPSKHRIDHPGLDIHYFHGYAIYDRVNLDYYVLLLVLMVVRALVSTSDSLDDTSEELVPIMPEDREL